MTTRRRIEITAFRRRTTITVRARPDVGPAEPSPCRVDASYPFTAEASQSEGVDLDQSQTTQRAVAGRLLREAAAEPASLKITQHPPPSVEG
jgi:hypothetical protein